MAGFVELGWGLNQRRQTREQPRWAWGAAPLTRPGSRLHLGCPAPMPWLLEVQQLAVLLQKPVLRLTLQCERGSADQQALGTLLETRGVRGQGPRSWFPPALGAGRRVGRCPRQGPSTPTSWSGPGTWASSSQTAF